jgi:hypothetical protein
MIWVAVAYAITIGLILTFLRGATYKENLLRDPNYYGERKNDQAIR